MVVAKKGRGVGLTVQTAELDDLSVTTGKINDLAVTTGKINDLAVTNGKINDVAVGKITGVLPVANGGTALSAIGAANTVLGVKADGTVLEYQAKQGVWTKLDYKTLGAPAASITSSTFTAKQMLMIVIYGKSNGGTKAMRVRFGNAGTIDSAANYAYTRLNAGVYEAGGGQSGVIVWPDTLVNRGILAVIWVINIAADKKIVVGTNTMDDATSGHVGGLWTNVTNQITDVQVRADIDGGTNQNFGTGSYMEIYGRNFND